MLIATAEQQHFTWPLVSTVISDALETTVLTVLKLSVAHLPSSLNVHYRVTMTFSGGYELLNCLISTNASYTAVSAPATYIGLVLSYQTVKT
jgi:hypothetical protein